MITTDQHKKTSFQYRLGQLSLVLRQVPKVIGLSWRAWRVGTILIPFLTLVAGVLPPLSFYFFGRVIDGVRIWIDGDASAGRHIVILFMSLEIAAIALQRGLDLLLQLAHTVLESRLRFQIQDMILRQAVYLDLSFFDTPAYHDKLQRAQREVGFRPLSIIVAMVHGTKEIITLLGCMLVVATLAWWMVPYLLVANIPALVIQTSFGWQGWMIATGRTPAERRMSYLQSILTSNRESKEVRLLGLGQYLAQRWKKLYWEFYRQDIKLATSRRLAELGAMLLSTLAYAGFYVYAVYCTVAKLVTIGSLIMYIQAMERANLAIGMITQSIASSYENSLYLRNLFEYLEQKPLIVSPNQPKLIPQPIRQGISFEGVTFRYPGAESDVLSDVSFDIPVGSRVALVGENGAGKSTLVKLLVRLYDPLQGRILVDGIDLREFDLEGWRRNLSVIFQDFARFCLTARENVGFGDLSLVDDLSRIRAAAELSGAGEMIEKLPGQWETVLGKMFEGGHELSVGQWQKVALARAFLKESSILVLDEPTASLDAKQEYEVFRQFEQLTAGKTALLISHRFSSVRMAQRIFVLKAGHLVEEGTHQELMVLNGQYAQMYSRQAAGYC